PAPTTPSSSLVVGGYCGQNQIYDCAYNCVNKYIANNHIGNNSCDNGSNGYTLTCSIFNNDGGDCSSSTPAPTSTSTPPPPPYAPTVKLSANGTKITASWNSVPDANSYTLFYAPYPAASPVSSLKMGTKTSYSTDLTQGGSFYVATRAYNNYGSSAYSNIEHFIINKPEVTQQPDLKANDWSVSYANNGDAALAFEIENIGKTEIENTWYGAFILSKDKVINTGDYVVYSFYSSGKIAPQGKVGMSADNPALFNIFTDEYTQLKIPNGSYYVIFWIDYSNEIIESSETNNKLISNGKLTKE
ncbi:MAG: CARDB domain-containing protein, partial [Pseudomonadota bacterium]